MTRPPAVFLIAVILLLALTASERTRAEQSGGGGVIGTFDGSISPRYLPRHRSVPVSITLSGSVRSSHGSPPPPLRRIEIGFGARGGLDAAGLPMCPRKRLRSATLRQALARCRRSLIGRGEISAEVPLSRREPLLAHARVLAFNGRAHGRPAVWLLAYAPSPPVSLVLPLYLQRLRSGAFGFVLRSPVRRALGRWPRLRSFEITLGRRYRAGHRHLSYLSAHCPLPPRFTIGLVPVARVTYLFDPGPTLNTTIQRGCRVRR